MTAYVSKLVIDGHMTHTRLRRETGRGQYLEVLVYAGEKAEGEPVGEWDMPVLIDYDGVATIAVKQTKFDGPEEGGDGS
jgi:hypothetical protein